MKEDFSEEVKKLISDYKKDDISYAKPVDFLLPRIEATKEEIEKDIINCENLKFTGKQQKDGETRYVMYFVYNSKKGRVYVVTFKDKIVIITAYPFGRRTLVRYRKRRFI